MPLLPRIMPAAATGLAMLALAVRLLGADATGPRRRPSCAGSPTTSPPRWTWRSGGWLAGCAPTPTRRQALRGTPPAELAHSLPRRGAAGDAAAGPRGVPAPVRAPRGGGDRPGRPALGRRPDLRARRPRQLPAPRRPGARARRACSPGAPREAEATIRDAHRAGPAARPGARRAGGLRAAPQPRSSPGCGSCPSPASSGRWPPPAPSSPLVGAQLAALGRLDAADDVFLLDLTEAHRALDGADLRAARGRAAQGGLRPGAAPPPGAARAALGRDRAGGRRTAAERRRPAPARHAGLGRRGHRRRAGDPRPGRRAPRPGRDPGGARRPTRAGRRCSSPPAGW